LKISPLIVSLVLLFWGWVCGIAGATLATTLMIICWSALPIFPVCAYWHCCSTPNPTRMNWTA